MSAQTPRPHRYWHGYPSVAEYMRAIGWTGAREAEPGQTCAERLGVTKCGFAARSIIAGKPYCAIHDGRR